MKLELDELAALWAWLKNHEFDRRWLAVGGLFVFIGTVILAKGPAGWLIEWMEERESMKDEGTKVWDI